MNTIVVGPRTPRMRGLVRQACLAGICALLAACGGADPNVSSNETSAGGATSAATTTTTGGTTSATAGTVSAGDTAAWTVASSGRVGGGAQILSVPAASSGTAVGWLHVAGAFLEFAVDGGASGGEVEVQMRYANGNAVQGNLSVYVNGTRQVQLPFASTGGWDNFQEGAVGRVRLAAGSNTVHFSRDSGDNPSPNLDRVRFVPLSAGAGSDGSTTAAATSPAPSSSAATDPAASNTTTGSTPATGTTTSTSTATSTGTTSGTTTTASTGTSAASDGKKDRIPLLINAGVDCYWCNFPLFVNLVDAAEAWRYNWDTSYDASLLVKDANGWVKKINGGGVARTMLGVAIETGGYRVSWKGKGRMQIVSSQNASVNVDVVATSDGTRTFNVPAPTELRLDIVSTDPADHLREIAIVAERYADTYRDQPFYPATLAYLKTFRGMRFMDFLATNNSPLVKPSDRATDTYFSQTAIAGSYEMAVRLCNATGRDCWLNIPHQANDDFVAEVARVVRDRLDPSLKVYVEYTNEAWNYGFQQAGYMRDTAVAQNVPGVDAYAKGARYYARRSAQIFAIFQQVLGSSAGQRLVRVLAGQSGATYFAGIHLEEVAGRLDAYAVAPYVGNDSNGGFGGAAIGWGLDTLFEQLNGSALAKVNSDLQAMQSFLSARSVPMIGYEGGQHLVDWGGNATLTSLYVSANRDARMSGLYGTYLDRWRAAGGREMALYSASGPYGRYGSWGLKENVTQPDAQSPKFQGVVNWMARNPKWW